MTAKRRMRPPQRGQVLDVAREVPGARKLMLGMSHRLMSEEKIEAVLQCAQASAGLPMLPQERAALMALASEAHRALKEFKKAKAEVERLSENTVAQVLAP